MTSGQSLRLRALLILSLDPSARGHDCSVLLLLDDSRLILTAHGIWHLFTLDDTPRGILMKSTRAAATLLDQSLTSRGLIRSCSNGSLLLLHLLEPLLVLLPLLSFPAIFAQCSLVHIEILHDG